MRSMDRSGAAAHSQSLAPAVAGKSPEPIRLGLVGLGNRGVNGWLRTVAATPDAELRAVCDRLPALVEDALARPGGAAAGGYVDLDSMLSAPDVDAVIICVAPEDAAQAAVRALDAGKHVLSEVPAAFTLDDCWALVEAVRRSGRAYALAEQLSYAPFTCAWEKLNQEGRLGHVMYGEAQYIHGMPDDRYWCDSITGERLTWEQARRTPTSEKSRLWNLHHPIWYSPHSLAPLLRALGTRVTSVNCVGTGGPSTVDPDFPNPDLEVALMGTEHGAVLRITASFAGMTAHPNHWHHLLGTRGEVETGRLPSPSNFGANKGALAWFAGEYQSSRQPTQWEFTNYQKAPSVRSATSTVGHGGLDAYPLLDFIEAIRTGRPPLLDVFRACEIAGAAIAAGLSADRAGVRVDVPDFRR